MRSSVGWTRYSMSFQTNLQGVYSGCAFTPVKEILSSKQHTVVCVCIQTLTFLNIVSPMHYNQFFPFPLPGTFFRKAWLKYFVKCFRSDGFGIMAKTLLQQMGRLFHEKELLRLTVPPWNAQEQIAFCQPHRNETDLAPAALFSQILE